jgi:hypothetical protein
MPENPNDPNGDGGRNDRRRAYQAGARIARERIVRDDRGERRRSAPSRPRTSS